MRPKVIGLTVLPLLLAMGPADGRKPRASAGPGDAGTPDPRPVLATLQRTECFGFCPVYKITVYADGTVEYFGQKWVKQTGARTAKLDAAQLKQLRQAFHDANYLELEGNADCYDETDNPTAITSFREGDRARTIQHYLGCFSAPKVLATLEERFDEIVGSSRWIGSQD